LRKWEITEHQAVLPKTLPALAYLSIKVVLKPDVLFSIGTCLTLSNCTHH